VARVASHFLCPCGECENMDLRECTCEKRRGATEVKAVIATLLHSGLTVDQAISSVAKEYGGLKPGSSPGTQRSH
jgi:hypothetical protein